jgi:hypothetical protein
MAGRFGKQTFKADTRRVVEYLTMGGGHPVAIAINFAPV